MSLRLRCTDCGASVSVDSQYAALQAGWAFMEINVKGRVKYLVLCDACASSSKLLKAALADPKPVKKEAE